MDERVSISVPPMLRLRRNDQHLASVVLTDGAGRQTNLTPLVSEVTVTHRNNGRIVTLTIAQHVQIVEDQLG